MATFSTEIPDFPAADFPALPEGFTDSSWHNDACPSIKNETLGLLIFIDYSDVAKRELAEPGPRFSVLKMDGEGHLEDCEDLLHADDWAEVLAFIATKAVPQ